MKTIKITSQYGILSKHFLSFIIGILVIALLWQCLPMVLQHINAEVGLLDNGIWQLLLFSFISCMLMLSISMLLFKWLLTWLGLPTVNTMVLQFEKLMLWQQFALYWASFALLFLGSLLSLVAIF